MTNTTSRLRFRVWDKQKAEFFSIPNGLCLTLDGTLAFNTKQGLYPIPDTGQPDLGRDRWVVEQWTGLTDSTGQPVFEGDIIQISEARYEQTLLNPTEAAVGETPIYEVHGDKPLPAPDVVLAKGVVEFGDAEFYCTYLWQSPTWSEGLVSTGLGALDRWERITVVGNRHQNRDLLT